jgi:hypothetical protein
MIETKSLIAFRLTNLESGGTMGGGPYFMPVKSRCRVSHNSSGFSLGD